MVRVDARGVAVRRSPVAADAVGFAAKDAAKAAKDAAEFADAAVEDVPLYPELYVER